jgi:hypothetical protein
VSYHIAVSGIEAAVLRRNLPGGVRRGCMRSLAYVLLMSFVCLSGSNLYAFSGGTGSAGDPYLISTAAELNTIGSSTSYWASYFKLIANIDMAAYTGTSYNIIGSYSTYFTGGFNGNGYIISNLTYTAAVTTDCVGMFGCTYGAYIQNVQLTNVSISSVNGSDVGGLIAYQYYGTTTNCYTTGAVSGGTAVGGLVGHLYGNSSSKLIYCYSTASVYGTSSRIGGLVGFALAPVSYCYSTGTVTATSGMLAYIGGLIGDGYWATVNDCYTTGNITVSSTSYYIGGLVGYLHESSIANCYSTGMINGSPTTSVGGLIGYIYASPTTACFWDTTTSGRTDGVGNQDPDQSGVTGAITSVMQTESTFTLAGWDFTTAWVLPVAGSTYPVLRWQASVYGGGLGTSGYPWKIYTKSQLEYLGNHPADYDNYFILMADIDLAATTYTQAIIAPDTDNATSGFQGTAFSGSFNGNSHIINNLTISDSAGRDYLGLFGYIGTAVAIQNLHVENVSITATGANSLDIGALAGYFAGGTVTGCHSTGTILASGTSSGSLGGLIGNLNTGTLTTCYSTCSVTSGASNNYIGGLVGVAHDNITTCYSTGNVYAATGSTRFGGLAGYHYAGTISNCYSTSAVSSSTSTRYGGGLIGHSLGSTISMSYCTGNVITQDYTGYDVGGLVGYNTSAITNCYARGEVDGDTRVGGLLGGNAGTITNCYSTGVVYTSLYGGGLIGSNTGTVTNCFWDKNTSGWNTSSGGTGKTTAQMKTESTFTAATWDFAWTDGDSADWVLWIEGQSYPTLAWQPATFGGGSGTLADPWKIDKVGHLLYLAYNSAYYSGSYLMTADIDMSAYTGTQYKVIGNSTTKFTGTFDGGGHIISNLTYSTASIVSNVGMFGYTSLATIRNLGLENELVHSHGDSVGGLIGYQYRGHVDNCFTTGSVAGRDAVGGMVGAELGSIDNSYSTASVTGTGTELGGGAGGLVGAISGYSRYGVRTCYSAGFVSGSTYVGGLIGYSSSGLVENSFWDTTTSGQATSAGGTGRTTAQMKTKSTFTAATWDFLDETANGTNDYWRMCVNGVNYPLLTWRFATVGDFACPDGDTIVDFPWLAQHWLLTGCTYSNDYCGWADMNVSGTVDTADLMIFADYWLQ